MSGAYLAYPYDESDLPVKASAMQAALNAYVAESELKDATQSIAFTYLALRDSGLVADYRIQSLDGRLEYFPAAGGTVQIVATIGTLNEILVNLVSANTGRSPSNGEAITYQSSTGNLIWGAPVYDASLDFSTTFNSMYIPLMFRKF